MLLSQDDVHKSADEWPKEQDPPQIGRSRGWRGEDRREWDRGCASKEGEVEEEEARNEGREARRILKRKEDRKNR